MKECRVVIKPLASSIVQKYMNLYNFRHKDQRTFPKHNVARQPISNDFPRRFNAGQLSVECPFCEALSFLDEKISCCLNGKICLEPLSKYPDGLKNLYINAGKDRVNFLANIRKFNNLFAFASTTLTPAGDVHKSAFAQGVVRICGQIYHRLSSLHPRPNMHRMFSQLYFYDGHEALRQRCESPLFDTKLSFYVCMFVCFYASSRTPSLILKYCGMETFGQRA